MGRKSKTAAPAEAPVIQDTIDENHADVFMAEVSTPATPEKKVELNSLLDSLVPKGDAEVSADDLIGRILATQPKKKGRKPKATNSVSFLNTLEPFNLSLPTQEKSQGELESEKAITVSKIQMNANNFELVLKDVLVPTKADFLKGLSKKPLSELKTILKTLEHTRSVNNTANQLKHFVFMGASAIEMGTQQFGMKTYGYSNLIRSQEEEIQSILREIAMENLEKLQKYQSPTVRLTLILTTSLLAVDARGRQMEYRQMNAPASPDMEQQYSDL